VNGALDQNFKLFLERVAAATGVELPTGETITEEEIAGPPVQETPTGPPRPPGDGQETGDIFSADRRALGADVSPRQLASGRPSGGRRCRPNV
jgi:hypothetical protein